MPRRIIGSFLSYDAAQTAIRELRQQNIPSEHISLIAPRPRDAADAVVQPEEPVAAEAAGGLTAAGAVVAANLILPGIGTVLAAGPLAALIGSSGEGAGEETDEDRRLQRLLVEANIASSEVDARVYLQDLRAGSTLLGVDTADEQEDMVAEILHRHGGTGLVYRPLGT